MREYAESYNLWFGIFRQGLRIEIMECIYWETGCTALVGMNLSPCLVLKALVRIGRDKPQLLRETFGDI